MDRKALLSKQLCVLFKMLTFTVFQFIFRQNSQPKDTRPWYNVGEERNWVLHAKLPGVVLWDYTEGFKSLLRTIRKLIADENIQVYSARHSNLAYDHER